MRVRMEFILPEDKDDLDLAMDGWKYKSVLSEFTYWLRNKYKHSDEEFIKLEEVSEELYSMARSYEVEM